MNGKIILLVEDNPDDEALAVRALERSGIHHELVIARDGVEALDYLLGTGAYANQGSRIPPSLVMLDLKLPKVDGLEVLGKIRATEPTRTIPVVVFTSSNEANDILQSYQLGANSYIRKPVDFAHFSEAVRQVGTYWLNLNLTPF